MRSDSAGQTLLFVHLSDIHFDAADNTVRGVNALARENLLDDLGACASQIGTPAAVLVTGDIAFSGQRSEFEQARAFLGRVTQRVGIDPIQVQTVPGNHDVDRSVVRASIAATHRQLREATPLEADKLLPEFHHDVNDPLFAPLTEYSDFASLYGCEVSGESPYWEVKWTLGHDSVLRMRGLTTCMVSDQEDDRPNLLVGSVQTSMAGDARNDVMMVLAHHPPDWWHDSDIAEGNMRRYVSVHLYGHKHAHHLSVVDDSVRLVAGAVHPEREVDWLPRYNWLRLTLLAEGTSEAELKVEIWPRTMPPFENVFRSDSTGGGWSPDVRKVPLTRLARNVSVSPRVADPSRATGDRPIPGPDPTGGSPAQQSGSAEIGRADALHGLPSDQALGEEEGSQPEEVLMRRPEVIDAAGQPTPLRTALYEFGQLGYATQQALLVRFNLIVDEDRDQPSADSHLHALSRLRGGQMDEFLAAVGKASKARGS